MSTSLSAQLAQIRGQVANPVDLKARKKAHSQSLLFEPDHASQQSFDTIYQVCVEGFEELCQIDGRFGQYAGALFSAQSKVEDRAQMTRAQNQELDLRLEDFLRLAGSKMQLQPTLKAIEWLIRRFRVHEHNSECLVYTFLPYHTSPIFVTVLSLLPEKFPQNLRFLHTYIQSFAKPPRHAIVHAMSNKKELLAAFSDFVYQTCRAGYEYQTLISFWASITTESVVAMAESSRSAQGETKKQNHEDILRLLLPLILDALRLEDCLYLKVGCYMILTSTASRLELDDGVTKALMAEIVPGWRPVSHAGLICLAALAEQVAECELPLVTLRALILLPNVTDDLRTLHQQYEVSKLTLGIIMGTLEKHQQTGHSDELILTRRLLLAGMLRRPLLEHAVRRIVHNCSINVTGSRQYEFRRQLVDLIRDCVESPSTRTVVQETLKQIRAQDPKSLPKELDHLVEAENGNLPALADIEMDSDQSGSEEAKPDFDTLVGRIDSKLAYEVSFLGHSESYIYKKLEDAFHAVYDDPQDLAKLLELPVLRKSLAMNEPLFLTFFIRVWCCSKSVYARTIAIRQTRRYLQDSVPTSDVQILIPYLIHALSDRQDIVRKASADLARTLHHIYQQAFKSDQNQQMQVLGRDNIYGQGNKSTNIQWLTIEQTFRLLDQVLLPDLEECVLDASHISSLLVDSLQGPRQQKEASTPRKSLKSAAKLATFTYLCNHTVNSPLYAFKFGLLRTLNQFDRVTSVSRTKLLLPILEDLTKLDANEFSTVCKEAHVNAREVAAQAVRIVIPRDSEGCKQLFDILISPSGSNSTVLRDAAGDYIQSNWSHMKGDAQALLSLGLLEQAALHDGQDDSQNLSKHCGTILRSVRLSTPILQTFLALIPPLFASEASSTLKRRKIAGMDGSNRVSTSLNSEQGVRRASLVLEVLEASGVENRPELLHGIFASLVAFQSPVANADLTVGYLQSLALDCLHTILDHARLTQSKDVDVSTIRGEVLIDCVRTAEQPQVRNKALLVLACLADLDPAMVIHAIMPIFTFMSTTVLTQEDDYSAYVVQQTMESVVSRLVSRFKKDKETAFAGVCELLHNFAAAFAHMPAQRRVGLFESLLDKSGPQDYLFALIIILADKFPQNKDVLAFTTEICNRYDAVTQLVTLDNICRIMLETLQRPNGSKMAVELLGRPKIDSDLFSVKSLRLAQCIAESKSLHNKVALALKNRDATSSVFREVCGNLFERAIELVRSVQREDSLVVPAKTMLNAILNLLPTPIFIMTIQALYGRASERIGPQVLEHFENRLKQTRDSHNTDVSASCLALLPDLVATFNGFSEEALVIAATKVIDRLIGKFGKIDISKTIDAAQIILRIGLKQSKSRSLHTACLLCLATVVEAATEASVPLIPDIFNQALSCIDTSTNEDTEDADLHNAGFIVLQSILLYVPWMITGSSIDQILKTSYECANADMGARCDQVRLETVQLIPRQDNTKECLISLTRTWTNAMQEGPQAVTQFFSVLQAVVDKDTKTKVEQKADLFCSLFIETFNLRHIQLSPRTEDSFEDHEIEKAETAMFDQAIAVIYKLNDASFRPIFNRLLDWATAQKQDGSRYLHRLKTFYSFAYKFFFTLKSIVTSYAGLITDNVATLLTIADVNDKLWRDVWFQILFVLRVALMYDQDDSFSAPSRFNPLSTALLAQLPRLACRWEQKSIMLSNSMSEPLVSTITALASAVDSSKPHHRTINTAVLAQFRSDEPAVRLGAVRCQRALTDAMGEEWVGGMLAEMVPYLSEAVEDDDEDVEHEVKMLREEIEECLGIDLEEMLQ